MPNIKREIIHFEGFYKALYGGPIRCYEIGESPDFSFEHVDKRIGVEHTQLFQQGSKDSSLAAIDSTFDDIARRVQSKGQNLDFNFNATLLFNIRSALKQDERELLARYIVELMNKSVVGCNLCKLETFEIRPENQNITLIQFSATKQELATRVSVARAGWVKRTIDEEVSTAILKKNRKVDEYRKKCDEIWLLIVANGHEPSSLFDKQPEELNIMCESEFDKIYYFDFFDKRITKIIINS